MFKSARIKLTIGYLITIFIITSLFSVFIFTGLDHEIKMSLEHIRQRVENREKHYMNPTMHMARFGVIQDYQKVKNQFLKEIIIFQGIIIILSTIGAYKLAGKTLEPISKSLKIQKRLISDVSHELRTPLTSLITNIEVNLNDKKMTLKQSKQLLADNLNDILNMKSIVNDLLEIDKTNNSNNYLSKFEIQKLIDNVYKNIINIANKKNIEFKIINKYKNKYIKANKTDLNKLLIIILENAIKYTKNGGKVNLKILSSKQNIKFIIKDNGIGIAKKDLPYIWDRFYKVDQSRSKQNRKSYGLGLSIAKNIINLHNGNVKIESTIEKGSSFIIELPIIV